MENTIVNLNGKILSPELAQVSAFDRSFLYGDSLYEVVRTYHGIPYKLEEHLQRLEKSALLCRMTLGQSLHLYAKEIQRSIQAFHEQNFGNDVYCRLIVTRGSGKIGFDLSCLNTPTQYVIIVQPIEWFAPKNFEKGLKLKITNRRRNDRKALDPAMKSGNYLNNLLAYLEASAEGFDDAILCNLDDFVTEGTTFNVFYVRRAVIATPPLNVGILAGITRDRVIQICHQTALPIREIVFPKQRIYEADEVFATSTLKEVYPVTTIDEYQIGDGRPGPLTRKLNEIFHQEALLSCQSL